MKKLYTKTIQPKTRIIIIVLLIIVAVIAVIFFLFRGCERTDLAVKPTVMPVYLEDEGSSADGEAKMKERDAILEELEKQQLVVTDKLSSNISFLSGEIGTVGEWIVENPQENNVIQQAEVYLDEVLIAKSTPIYPNQHITGVSLLAEIEAGEYEVTAYINYYDIETKEFISKAGYKIHLTVR